MNKNIKIATILPYKENYTVSKAQAAAIWVADFYKYSRFKENNFIFGHTKDKDYLSKKYININISNLKSKFSSSTKEYCKNIIKKSKKMNFDIIEIHNRPKVFEYLSPKLKSDGFVRIEENPPPFVLVVPEKINLFLLKEKPPSERPPITLSFTVIQFVAGLSSVKS